MCYIQKKLLLIADMVDSHLDHEDRQNPLLNEQRHSITNLNCKTAADSQQNIDLRPGII